MSGASISSLVVPGFAFVTEATRRSLQMVHYDVQLQCGIAMSAGHIAEMKTGEGKTLTAALAAYLMGIFGKGVHVVTFNDYLAKRDRDFLLPAFRLLGLTASVLSADLPPEQRRQAYLADITYGAAKEFGFDFLRDRLKSAETNTPSGVMRGTHFALIDEADSILIDEARTPLIIGIVNQTEESIRQLCFGWAAAHAAVFNETTDYEYDEIRKTVKLTANGIGKARGLPQNEGTRQMSIRQLYQYLQNAIKVQRDFQRDKHYAIQDGEIVIIDEFTGRPAEGRQWQNGIHQSVQAKEGVEITPATGQAATVTVQSYFKRYPFLCGMTGTAWNSRRELKKVYQKKVVRIPTHRPEQRHRMPPRVFATNQAKFEAIAVETAAMLQTGRSVLIGTRSVEISEQLATTLEQARIRFQILNAKYLEKEAEIVAEAGQPKRVTVATNMAGRGTDIKLDPTVREAGGLHVILTEIHESERIDRQLIGRGARQGDPGSYQVFVSLEDEILRIGLGAKKAKQLANKYAGATTSELASLFPVFRRAQRKTAHRYLVDRLIVLKQDLERQKSLFDTGQDPFLNIVTE